MKILNDVLKAKGHGKIVAAEKRGDIPSGFALATAVPSKPGKEVYSILD
jgi:hypothetical protein